MKTIKTYEDFINEEINLKKALATGALAAGMALSNPVYSQKVDKYLSDRVDTSYVKIVNKIGTLSKDSLIGYYRDVNGKWNESKPSQFLGPSLPYGGYMNDISTYKISFDDKEYILMSIGNKNYITTKYLYDSLLNYKKGEIVKVNFDRLADGKDIEEIIAHHLEFYKKASTDQYSSLLPPDRYKEYLNLDNDDESTLLVVFGENFVRFRMGDSKNDPPISYSFKYCYNECKIEEFNKILNNN